MAHKGSNNADLSTKLRHRMTKAAPAPMKSASISTQDARIVISGALLIDTLTQLPRGQLPDLPQGGGVIDVSDVTRMDTAGAWYVVDMQKHAATLGAMLEITGTTPAQAQLIETVLQNMPPDGREQPAHKTIADRFEEFGRKIARGFHMAVELTSFLGQVIATLGNIIRHPSRLRLTSVVHHCQEIGVSAVPIVALMAFLIGVVLAFQGSHSCASLGRRCSWSI